MGSGPLGNKARANLANSEKQARDEVEWVTAMTIVAEVELAHPPAKRAEPEPDVLLLLMSGQRIGVEVVEAVDETLRKGYAGRRTSIVRTVTAEMRRRRLNANVGLYFPDGVMHLIAGISGKKERAMCEAIVECVAESLMAPFPRDITGRVFVDPGPANDNVWVGFDNVGELTSRGLELLGAISIAPWHEPVVITAVFGSLQKSTLIQDAIDRKAAKLRDAKYDLTELDETWLLVVGSTGTAASLSVHQASNGLFVSPFARTYFLECYEEKCVRLKTTT